MICTGPLRLLYPGGEARLTPELVAPTNHHPGQHGDLYACRDCGTVHQPGLPRGEELTEAWRSAASTRVRRRPDGAQRRPVF